MKQDFFTRGGLKMKQDFFTRGARASIDFAFTRENNYDFEDLRTVINTLGGLINDDRSDVSSEDKQEIESLKQWMKKEIQNGFMCFDLRYHGDAEEYNIVSTIPELLEAGVILGILDEFECVKTDPDDIYYYNIEDEDEEE